jgi:hypothetical protein
MIARCRPSGKQSAAIPFADPFGLNGYCIVAQQGQDVGLEQAPQDDGIEGGRVDEAAVRPEGPCGSQDMQVGMPVPNLPGRLEGDDGGGKGVLTGIVAEERGHRLPGAQRELRKKLPPIPGCRPQDLGKREDFDAGAGRSGSPAPG